MKLLVATLIALAVVPAAHAAQVSIVSRDVPLHAGVRTLAAAPPQRFNMVALHWRGAGVPYYRTRHLNGRWSDWIAADDDWGHSGAWRKQGSPDWVGASNRIEYRLRGPVTSLRAFFLRSPVERAPMRRLSIAGSPSIIPRASWQADETILRGTPLYADTLRYAVVHHTVNTNAYSPAQSAAIVRGIEVYHVKGNGWNDIGYNFLVDKYGQVFEGRAGGIERNVIGAHSQGFNTGSVGVAVIGTYDKSGLPTPARTALEQLLSWRLDVAHVDPLSTMTLPSGGNSKFPAGVPVFLRAVSGHRDTYFTECPGNALYSQLPSIAKGAAALGLPKLYAPVVTGKIGGPVRFTGRLSNALAWTVTVTDAAGMTVGGGTGTSANVDWTWDATAVPPGTYTWTMSAGPTLRGARGVIGAKLVPLAITKETAAPAITTTSSTVTYTLSAAATVTATLVDEAGAPIAPLFTETKPAGKQSFAFSAGPTVADGAYTILLQAQSPDGQQTTAVVGIQIDRTVASFTAKPAVVSPNGDGLQDSVGIAFTLAHASDASVEVQRDGVAVATLATGSFEPGAAVTATWDGTAGGAPAPDGSYTAVLRAGSTTRSIPVVVDTRPPALRPISWTRLQFAVNEPGTLTLRSGSQTWTKKVRAAGTVWFSLRVKPKRYTVVARDAAGNAASLRRR